MPLVSQTRITIEDLDAAYDRLLPVFKKENQRPGRGK
jgi:hypothetical protein